MCIDIVEICFGNADRQIRSIFDRVIFPQQIHIFIFKDDNLVNIIGFSPNGVCIDIVEICFRIADRQISSVFDRVICPEHNNGRVLSFHILLSF